jgi:ATP/maltotriose-dependent transcriptional regulator MalT
MASSRDADESLEALGLRAQVLAKSGRLEEAERTACSIPDADGFCGWLHEKAVALVIVASGFADRGEKDRARALVGEAVRISRLLGHGGTWQEADTLVDVGAVMARMGATEEALEHWTRAASLSQVCQAHDEECGKILAQISFNIAGLGLWDQAASLAESITFERLRQRTLNELQNRRRGQEGRGVPE